MSGVSHIAEALEALDWDDFEAVCNHFEGCIYAGEKNGDVYKAMVGYGPDIYLLAGPHGAAVVSSWFGKSAYEKLTEETARGLYGFFDALEDWE